MDDPQQTVGNADDDAAATLLSPHFRTATFGLVATISLLAFETMAVAAAMPSIATELDGLRWYAFAFAGMLAASIVGIVVTGPWADRSGPAPPLWNGVAWFVAGLLLAGFAPSMPFLVLGRIVQGVGTGSLAVAAYVVVGRYYPQRLQPRIFAVFSAAWVLPSLVGPTISGLIVTHLGWRCVFLLVPLLAIPAALLVRPALRGLSGTGQAGQKAPLGWAIAAAAGVLALHLASQRVDLAAVALLLGGLAALLAGARQLMPAGVLAARRGLATVFLVRGLVTASFFGSEAYVPLILTRTRELGPVGAGAVLTFGAIGWSAGSWTQGRIGDDRRRILLLGWGQGLILLGTLVMALVLLPAAPLATAYAGWLLTGYGMGLSFPCLSVLMLRLSPADAQGRNASALQLAESIAVSTTLGLSGAALNLMIDRRPLLALLLPVLLSGALVVVGLAVHRRVQLPAAGPA